ncbi:hypothetical protein [Terriglobus aquaticus]|uniref:VPDSG-CTERM protein sorting domain-containing protein n=1 Tax=Terriglobus aquaticus TaxID=940139 RepID=A0ABW9KM29_9BACT|nr:hypothetical protein [Terriglobus aquaticus]
MTFRRILALAVCAIAAPLASRAQSCPPGYTFTSTPTGFTCTLNPPSAPEIGASSSIGGVAVLLGGALMLRGRKRKVAVAEVAA